MNSLKTICQDDVIFSFLVFQCILKYWHSRSYHIYYEGTLEEAHFNEGSYCDFTGLQDITNMVVTALVKLQNYKHSEASQLNFHHHKPCILHILSIESSYFLSKVGEATVHGCSTE